MSTRLATLAAGTAAVLLCAAAQAAPPLKETLSKQEVKANKVRIEEQYDQSQARCRRLTGPARELCNEQARGERDVQSAELQMRVEPSADNDEKVRLARAEARYAQALVRCKSFDGPARGVCRKDAKTSFEAARMEAKLQKEVTQQDLRSEATVKERTAAADRIAGAQYDAARERCETLPGEGRANCLEDVKKRFGRL